MAGLEWKIGSLRSLNAINVISRTEGLLGLYKVRSQLWPPIPNDWNIVSHSLRSRTIVTRMGFGPF